MYSVMNIKRVMVRGAATVLSECQGSFCGRGLLSARKLVLREIGNSSRLINTVINKAAIDIGVQKREELAVVDAIHIH